MSRSAVCTTRRVDAARVAAAALTGPWGGRCLAKGGIMGPWCSWPWPWAPPRSARAALAANAEVLTTLRRDIPPFRFAGDVVAAALLLLWSRRLFFLVGGARVASYTSVVKVQYPVGIFRVLR